MRIKSQEKQAQMRMKCANYHYVYERTDVRGMQIDTDKCSICLIQVFIFVQWKKQFKVILLKMRRA